jgi:hypothetical protein
MIEKLGIYVTFISGALVWAGEYFYLPWLASLALVLFGGWVILWGVEIAFKGKVTLFDEQRWRHQFFSGIPAGLWSALLITFGAGIVFLAWLDFSSPAGIEGFLDRLVTSPRGWGLLVALGGMIVTAGGLIRLLAGSAPLSGQVYRLEDWGVRLGGLVNTLFGAALLALAAGLLLAPGLLSSLFQWLVEAVKTRLLDL